MQIASVGTALPPHFYGQEELLAGLERLWGDRLFNPERLTRLHRNVLVEGRHLALPMEEYLRLDGFTAANDAWVRCAVDLGAAALEDGLARARLTVSDVDHILFVSTTGVATPSIDARLVNRLGLRTDIRRTPIFGLGCLGGVAGIARAADWLAAHRDGVAALLAVELCSLTLQREDLSVPNLIASGLFGDGAAAAILVGGTRADGEERDGPRVVATRSSFYPDTERLMGWEVGSDGFRVVLSADVPDVVRAHAARDVDAFLAEHGLDRADVARWILHPGGPRVLEALEESLSLSPAALARSWRTLAEVGNLSSVSALLVLERVMAEDTPAAGTWGLMMAMGPGFCSEFALLRW